MPRLYFGLRPITVIVFTALAVSARAETNKAPELSEVVVKDDSLITNAPEGAAERGYSVDNVQNVGLWGTRKLADIPYSMTSTPAQLIQNAQVRDTDQLFKMNPLTQPGVPLSTMDATDPIIRGFTASTFIDGNQILGNSRASLEDKERVDIISGAQSFLNDSASIGGSVNYIYKRPTKQRLNELTLGNYGGQQYYQHIDLGGPIDDEGRFGYRLNAVNQNGETSIQDQKLKHQLFTLALDWHVTDNLLLQPIYSYRKRHMDNGSSWWNSIPDFYDFIPDPHKAYGEKYSYFNTVMKTYGTKASWDATDWLSFEGEYLRNESTDEGDRTINYHNADGSWNQYYYNYYPAPQRQDIGHLYAHLSFATAWLQHKVVMGYNASRMVGHQNARFGISLLNGLTDEHPNAPQPDTFKMGQWNVPNHTFRSAISERNSYKLGDEIAFNDQWSVIVGGSYSQLSSRQYIKTGEETKNYNKSKLTPTYSLIYKPLPFVTTYATYIEGLEEGAIVTGDFKNAGDILPPTVSKQYELGTKIDLDPLLLTAALFRLDKANQFSDNGKPLPTMLQDGRQIHQGVELTATGKITDNLTIVGGATFADEHVEKTDDPSVKGKRPTDAAERMYKLYTEYSLPFYPQVALTGGVYYVGDSYADAQNKKKIPAYTTGDVGARYTTKFGNYPTTFRLSVTNVTDKAYWATQNSVGMPRTVVFSGTVDF